MNKNCNSFSSKFSKLICGEDIPPWVNRLAYLTTFVPFIEKMIPREWISPVAIQHTLDQHRAETTDQCQNGSSLTRSTNPDDASSMNSNSSMTISQSSQETKSLKQNIWPLIFSNEQSDNASLNNQNRTV